MAGERNYNFFVSTVIPALNEEGNIEELCQLYDEMAKAAPFKTELVFVDDGSTDDTLEKIKQAAEKYDFIRYASHQRNRGLTEALQTGFAIARGDVYVFYPADLQYLPEDIPRLVEPIAEGADLSTGWKQGRYRKWFVSGIYNWISRKIFGLKVHDLNAVKAFRKEIVRHIFLRRDWHRYLVVLAANEGFKVEEVPVRLYERRWGTTKFSVWRIPIGVLDMLAVKFQITFLKKPLLFFGLIGCTCFGLGFLVGLWAIYLKYWLGETQLPLLYLVILLVGLGFGLFLMGFMAEGQTAIKEEVGDLRRKLNRLLEDKSQES
ncbi:MAG: glycosyltransferase family 2 protein [Candidatus Zixiibacteriota bacterium]|nr:MAG: glycosyltransferase family 2 protein [candidate division Zixibacteria bacterium]